MSLSVQSSQNQLLLESLMVFYKNREHLDKLKSILDREKTTDCETVSLRAIDWFVTNYAKKHYTVYDLPVYSVCTGEVREIKRFKVYYAYKAMLSAYSKSRFDPFCRSGRILIPYDETSSMETTIGQMNFFKWAIENRIIDYVQQNYKAIENDMNARNTTSKRVDTPDAKPGTTRKKRQQLSVSASACLKKETVQITMKFT